MPATESLSSYHAYSLSLKKIKAIVAATLKKGGSGGRL